MPTKSSARKSTKRAPSKKSTTKNYKSEYGENQKSQRQISAIILFTVGILLASIVLIKGTNIWEWLHNFFYGIFALPILIIPTALIYIAIMATLDKPIGEVKHKLWQTGVLVALVCGLFEVCTATPYSGDGFFNVLGNLYVDGVALKGGGFFSALIGFPLYAAAGKAGSIIVLTLLLFAFVMLLTGATLIGLFKSVYKPVKKIEETYVQKREVYDAKASTKSAVETVASASTKFDINVDLGPETDLPEHPVSSPKPTLEEILGMEDQKPSKKEEKAKQKEREKEERINAEIKIKASSAQLDELVKKAVIEPPPVFEVPTPTPIEPEIVEEKRELSKIYADGNAINKYVYPPSSLLKAPKFVENRDISEELKSNAALLVDTLKSFGVQTRVIDISRGPTVTRYELQPSAGVKISKITGLSDDIALNLASAGVRIEAPIPNKAAVGIEVPNKNTDIVTMREIIESNEFLEAKSKLSMALGKDIAGNSVVADVGKMPHMLIAGATGSGKSVCINSIIISLLYKSAPSEVRFLMIDPKVVELGVYNGIPHLLVPVVTDPRKAAGALGWAVTEMLNRYKLFADNNVRDLTGYNKVAAENEEVDPLPQIVIIIDELADLMMAAPNEVEDSICRLAQMARAAGMHLVIATQRPSVDVITGVIKANIPSRIAFAVSSQIDSRTILDSGGAEKLLGRGDMLFYPVGMPKPLRVQGCFVSDKEVEAVVEFVKNKENVEYDDKIIEEIEKQAVVEKGSTSSDSGGGFEDDDNLLPNAIDCVVEAGQASTSYLQRKLKVGYARAARLIDDMEAKGIIGTFEGSKPRQILMSKQQWMEKKMNDKK